MKAYHIWPRLLAVVGLFGMLIGVVDPLEGSVVILVGVGLVALGAALGGSQRRNLLWVSVALVAIGVAAMVVLSWLGGIGGDGGRSKWWAILILPYAVGWILGIAGAVLAAIEFSRELRPQSPHERRRAGMAKLR